MRLYVTPNGQWAGTQADAKAIAKEEGTGWEQVEVPTDKEGLLCFLNCHRVDGMCSDAKAMMPDTATITAGFAEAMGGPLATDTEIERQRDHQAYQPDPEKVARSEAAFTATQMEDFILHRATVAQVENLFACLGNRFAEARKH